MYMYLKLLVSFFFYTKQIIQNKKKKKNKTKSKSELRICYHADLNVCMYVNAP